MASISYNYMNGDIDQVVTLTVVETGYSVANNTSDIKWTLDISAYGGSTWVWTGITCVVNGTTVYDEAGTSGFPFPARPGSVSGTISGIPHNSDGTKSISFSFSGWMYAYADTFSKSGSLTLTNIPRSSTMSFPEFTAGQSGTFSITRALNNYTHTIQYPIGTNIATNITTSYTWTPSISLCNLFPSSQKGTIKVRLITYNGNTQVGYRDYDVTIKVPSNALPDFSYILSESTQSGFGRYVSGLSSVKASITNATGIYGSHPVSATISINGISSNPTEIESGEAVVTSNILNSTGTITVTVSVTDSRGQIKTKTSTITVYDYYDPNISDVDLDISGTTVSIHVTGSIAPVDNTNTKFITIEQINSSTGIGTVIVNRAVLSDYIFDVTYTITVPDITTVSYDYIVTLEDRKNSVSIIEASGIVCISRYAGGKGVRFFGEAYKDGFVVGDVDYTITTSDYADIAEILASEFNSEIIYQPGTFVRYQGDIYEIIRTHIGFWSESDAYLMKLGG